MIKLWLDDVRECPYKDWVTAKSASEAIFILKTGLVTHMSFDHDLGNDEDGTGYTVSCWVEDAAFNNLIQPIQWKIHSANPVGVNKIRSALESADKYWNR